MTAQEQAMFIAIARWNLAGMLRDYMESVKLSAGGAPPEISPQIDGCVRRLLS